VELHVPELVGWCHKTWDALPLNHTRKSPLFVSPTCRTSFMDCSGRMQSHIHPSSPLCNLHTNTPTTQLQTCIVIQTDGELLHPSDELSISAQFTRPPLHRFLPAAVTHVPKPRTRTTKYLARAPVSTLNGTVEMLSNTWRSAKRRRLTAGFAECSSQLWQPQGMMVRSFGNGAWRPGSVLDEYVAAHRLEKGDMLTLLAITDGRRKRPVRSACVSSWSSGGR
jgi:hypothetical protein